MTSDLSVFHSKQWVHSVPVLAAGLTVCVLLSLRTAVGQEQSSSSSQALSPALAEAASLFSAPAWPLSRQSPCSSWGPGLPDSELGASQASGHLGNPSPASASSQAAQGGCLQLGLKDTPFLHLLPSAVSPVARVQLSVSSQTSEASEVGKAQRH